MEKYGVWTEDTHRKTASGAATCPQCGSKNVIYGTVPRCNNCGTAPWEKKASNGKEENRRWKRT